MGSQAGVSDSPCLCKEGEWQDPQGSCPLQPSCPEGETDGVWLGTDTGLGPGRLILPALAAQDSPWRLAQSWAMPAPLPTQCPSPGCPN